jgi:hypothetical protein
VTDPSSKTVLYDYLSRRRSTSPDPQYVEEEFLPSLLLVPWLVARGRLMQACSRTSVSAWWRSVWRTLVSAVAGSGLEW